MVTGAAFIAGLVAALRVPLPWPWLLVCAVIAFIGLGIFMNRRDQRYATEEVRAMQALGRGDLPLAWTIFTWGSQPKQTSRTRARALVGLGWTLLRQGKLDKAIETLGANDARSWRDLRTAGLAVTSATYLAICYALEGDLDAAETWLAAADKRAKHARAQVTDEAMKAFARAIIDVRRDRGAEAAAALDDHWTEWEGVLPGDKLRPLRVLKAFALAGGGPRDAGIADSALEHARPAYPGEYEMLSSAWPEMASFLATHEMQDRISDGLAPVAERERDTVIE